MKTNPQFEKVDRLAVLFVNKFHLLIESQNSELWKEGKYHAQKCELILSPIVRDEYIFVRAEFEK